MKTCTQCGLSKPADLSHFPKDVRQSSGLRPNCRDCYRLQRQAHYQANIDQVKSKSSARKNANRDEINRKQREAHARKMATNPEAVREKRRAYYKNGGQQVAYAYVRARMKSDPKFRIRVNLGQYFARMAAGKPQGGFQKIVGYTVSDLHHHLERQFQNGMNWDNYGSVWEIDHIVPVKSFNLPEEAAACWALSNLRPLLSEKNRRKSSQSIYLI